MNLIDVFDFIDDDAKKVDATRRFITKSNNYYFDCTEAFALFKKMTLDPYRQDILSLMAPSILNIYQLIPCVFPCMNQDSYRLNVIKILKAHVGYSYKMSYATLATLFGQLNEDSSRIDLVQVFPLVSNVKCADIAGVIKFMAMESSMMTVMKYFSRPSDPQKGSLITENFTMDRNIQEVENYLDLPSSTVKKQNETALVFDTGSNAVGRVQQTNNINIPHGRDIKIINNMKFGSIYNDEIVTEVTVFRALGYMVIGNEKFVGGKINYNGCTFDTVQRKGEKVFHFTDVEAKHCLLTAGPFVIRRGILYDVVGKLIEMVDPFDKPKDETKKTWITKEQLDAFIEAEKKMEKKGEIAKEKECGICQERVADHVYTCGHFNCIVCAYKMQESTGKQCPICRKQIEGIIHTFM